MCVCGGLCECVCTFWANKSQTGKQTNKLATEIGNSRMPFSITLASDQRAAADAAADVRQRGAAAETKATDERGGAAAEASTKATQVEVGYGQCLHSLRSATFITYAYAYACVLVLVCVQCLCECALSVCAYVSAYLCILVAIFMRSRAMQTFLMSFYNNSSLHYGHSHGNNNNNNQKQYQLHCSIARRTKFSL